MQQQEPGAQPPGSSGVEPLGPLDKGRALRLFRIVEMLLVRDMHRQDIMEELARIGLVPGDSTLNEDLGDLAKAGWVQNPGSGSKDPYRILPNLPLYLTPEEAMVIRQARELASPTSSSLTQRFDDILARLPMTVRSVVERRAVAEVWQPFAPYNSDRIDEEILKQVTTHLARGFQFRVLHQKDPSKDPLWYTIRGGRLVSVDGALALFAFVPDSAARAGDGSPWVTSSKTLELRLDRVLKVASDEVPLSLERSEPPPFRWLYAVTDKVKGPWQPPRGHVPIPVGGIPGDWPMPEGWRLHCGEAPSSFRAVRWLVEKGDFVYVPRLEGSDPLAVATNQVHEDYRAFLRSLTDICAAGDVSGT